ncbi:hypothetical protein DQ04_06561000, partial [Trypanosoma grayi]|uniref:hypothetical protein n=1 Tax=Trypanosoma grayi TaxID=71804 RepID=UPI0004F3F232
MRRDPSPQFPLPSGHLDERSYRPFQHDTAERPYDEFDSGRHRSSTRWDAQGESYVPFAGDHSGRGYEISGPRVSDLLQPKLVNDIGLQRALQRPKERSHHLHHHHHRSHSAGGGGGRRKETELPAQLQQRPDDSFVPCYYDPGDDNNDDRRGCSMPRTLSVSDGVQASRPMVDVVAAFGRASGSGGSLAAAAVGGAGVTAASEATAVSSSVAKEARRQKTPEAAERAMQTTPPRVQVERGEAEPT